MLEITEELQENNEVQAKIEDLYNKLQLFIYRLAYDEYGEITNTSYNARDKNDNIIFTLDDGKAFEFSIFIIDNGQAKFEDFEERTDYSIYQTLINISELVAKNGSPRRDILVVNDFEYTFTFNGQPFPVTNPPIDDNLGIGKVNVALNGNIFSGEVTIMFSLDER